MINLCEILKDHIGETFYSPAFGELILDFINEYTKIILLHPNSRHCSYTFNSDGTCVKGEEVMLFPSKDNRDWNTYIKKPVEQIRTWSDYCENMEEYYDLGCGISIGPREDYSNTNNNYPIELSSLALFKMRILIDDCYGRNVTKEEWKDNSIKKYTIIPSLPGFEIIKPTNLTDFRHFAFHTKELAKEFMSYEENVELLKEYYML